MVKLFPKSSKRGKPFPNKIFGNNEKYSPLKIYVALLQYQKAASKIAEAKVNYRFLSGFLVTFTTAIAIVGKDSFAMPWLQPKLNATLYCDIFHRFYT